MRDNVGRVELLCRAHEGLGKILYRHFFRGGDFYEAQQIILKAAGETIPLSTISTWKQRYFLNREKRLQKMAEWGEAIERAGVSKGLRAHLYEMLNDYFESGEKLDFATAMREDRERSKIALLERQLEVDREHEANVRRGLEIKVTQFETQQAQAKEAIEEVSQQIGNGQLPSPEDVLKLRERVLGPGPQAAASH